jgi:hypothetical protein
MASTAKHLEEAFANLKNLKPEHFDAMIEETVKTIHLLQSKVDSKDPKDAKLAFESVLDLKESLEEQMTTLMEGIGVNAGELKEFMLNPDNFSDREKELMKEIDNKLVELNVPPKKETEPKKVKTGKRSKTAWIPG